MGKPRYKWLGYVQWMIRLYPERLKELRRLQEASRVASYGGVFCGSEISRPTERRGMVSLGATCDREVEAVRRAIETTKAKRNGDLTLKLIDLEFWRRSHNMTGAAAACYLSESTAKRLRCAFIQEVGRNFGLCDYTDEARKLKPEGRGAVG